MLRVSFCQCNAYWKAPARALWALALRSFGSFSFSLLLSVSGIPVAAGYTCLLFHPRCLHRLNLTVTVMMMMLFIQ